ncbi:TPA: helix-turn-helix transcriptional regulator [Streptococcus suis]|nr:helix-turn-helix transcriptional regulator [Streptococcus suis]NQJ62929.1 helix-turn-helix transcriptional regulator [Streptococcus suis]NQJ95377.1 helix-turn-helix transcriptional regulator [Streptococcus suis]NQK66613.1 helix-turn-helix transcriptional regulator [Streptococcus suis]NQK76553.1 helix-turn-helix transcriptional regulator [Streptococcus suis]
MNRLKILRKEKGLSQQALAKEIGVSYRTLQNWENGVNTIKPDKAQALADHFGVSVGYLLGFSSESSKNVLTEFKEGEYSQIEEDRAKIGNDKLILYSTITDTRQFLDRMQRNIDMDAIIRKLPLPELLKLKNPKEREKFARKQMEPFIREMKNLAIALSYLTDEESELLARFYVLNKQDKDRLLQIARTFTED